MGVLEPGRPVARRLTGRKRGIVSSSAEKRDMVNTKFRMNDNSRSFNERIESLMESLILAQDERWRRA